MFKKLTVYRLPAACIPEDLETLLAALPFKPCGPTEPISFGFVPPRGHDHGLLAERINGHVLITLRTEKRLLPGSVVREKVDALAQRIHDETGRKPGAKRRRELKDEALLDLLPQSFTRQSATRVWIAPERELLVVDTTSNGALDAILTALCKAIPGLAPMPLQTAESPSACMRAWLLDGVAPAGFGIGRETELRSNDVQSATVRYTRHGLEGDDVQTHLKAGKEVRRLALNWKDRVDFTLTENLQLTGIKFDDGVFANDGEKQEIDPFDGDAVLMTSELSAMLDALFVGLGGQVDGLGAKTAQPE